MDNYHRLFQQVGWDRFATAVDKVIFDGELLFMPSIAEFKQHLPPPTNAIQQEQDRAAWERDMRAKRAARPEEFFGEADVTVMMRMVTTATEGNLPAPGWPEIEKAIMEARAKYKYKPAKQVIPEREFTHFED